MEESPSPSGVSQTWSVDDRLSPQWKALFEREGVAMATPVSAENFRAWELGVLGKTAVAISHGLGDVVPELRALAWKRDARVAPGGIDIHEKRTVLAAIAARDADDARALTRSPPNNAVVLSHHGDMVLVELPGLDLPEDKVVLSTVSGGRPFAVEVFEGNYTPRDFAHAKAQLGNPLKLKPRLLVSSAKAAELSRFMGTDWKHSLILNHLLFENLERRKRVAVLAYRHNARVRALEGEVLKVTARLSYPVVHSRKGRPTSKQAKVDPADLEIRLREQLAIELLGLQVKARHANEESVVVEALTTKPALVMSTITSIATQVGCKCWMTLDEAEPLRLALWRLVSAAASSRNAPIHEKVPR